MEYGQYFLQMLEIIAKKKQPGKCIWTKNGHGSKKLKKKKRL